MGGTAVPGWYWYSQDQYSRFLLLSPSLDETGNDSGILSMSKKVLRLNLGLKKGP